MTESKKRRRGHGEGAVYKAPDGRWRGSVDLGWQEGKRIRKYVSGGTRAEATAKLRQLQRDADQGVEVDARLTVEGWLVHWLETVVDGRVGSANTVANYRTAIVKHIVPALGKIKLADLRAEHVDRFLKSKADAGLSRSYISRMRTLLSDALRHAERRGLVPRNAAALSVMPKTKPPAPRRSFTAEEALRLIEAAAGERLEALVIAGLVAGLRPGELGGLVWSDLDLDSDPPLLTVSGSMKLDTTTGSKARGAVKRSTAGRRTIALPPLAVVALEAHRRRQAAERLKAGPLWSDHGLVFCNEIGEPLNPSTVRTMFGRVAKRAGVDGAAFPYLMRHTATSLLLDDGATIEEVADILGDDPRTIYKHYRHRVRPVASAATRMQSVLAASESPAV